MVKFAHLDDAFFEVKPIRRPITVAKTKEKGEKGKGKKIKKYKSLTWRDVDHFLVSKYACLSQIVVKYDASGRKASFLVVDAFLTRLKLIWPISSLKISKMPKKCILGKKLQDYEVVNIRSETKEIHSIHLSEVFQSIGQKSPRI